MAPPYLFLREAIGAGHLLLRKKGRKAPRIKRKGKKKRGKSTPTRFSAPAEEEKEGTAPSAKEAEKSNSKNVLDGT